MACSVDTSQPLSSVTPITQRAHGQSVHGGRDESDTWASATDFTQADLATGTAECSVCQLQRPSQYGTIPWSEQPGTFDWYLLWYGFAFAACNTSAQTIIHRLIVLSAIIIFYIALLLIEELTLQKKKCGNGPRPMDFLVSMVEWCFEDSSVMSVRWQYFEQLDICWLYVIWISVQYIVLFPL